MNSHRQRRATSDPRPTGALVKAALDPEQVERRWDVVAVLHARGSEAEFEAAVALAEEADPEARRLGADILGQLGWSDRAFLAESVPLLIGLLGDPEAMVIASAATALGHRGDPSAIAPLSALIAHEDFEVRYGVVHGLTGHEDEQAVAALIELSRDEAEGIRDWATFALAVQIDWDSPELLDALRARLDDEDNVTRGEAMVGLGRRRCETTLGLLMEELGREDLEAVFLDAAEAFADPRLLPGLRAHLVEGATGSFAMALESAIEACTPGEHGDGD